MSTTHAHHAIMSHHSQTCHDEASIMSPHAMNHVNIISQTCHGRGYTPRHSPNNTPQGAAGSASKSTPRKGLRWHALE